MLIRVRKRNLVSVFHGNRERVGHQVAAFIAHVAHLSTVSGPEWPKVFRLTRHTERSYRVSIVAAFSISRMDFSEVEL
jgi:hypothetical protein